MLLIEDEISVPINSNMPTNFTITSGAPITPLKRLEIMESGEWEIFTLELVTHWKSKFKKVVRCGGGGDMGRDVIAYTNDNWENFQCKFYSTKLAVADIVTEVGKHIYYCFIGELNPASFYYFVTPKGCSTDSIKLFQDKTKIKNELISRWDKTCKTKITSTKKINLDNELLAYVNSFNYEIFDDIPPLKLIELHSQTPYHSQRFGNYHKVRQTPPLAPTLLGANEKLYVDALMEAFSENVKTEVDISNLNAFPFLVKEFDSARNNFYSTEALAKFSRDWLGDDPFNDLKDQCYEGISPDLHLPHSNGFVKYMQVQKTSVTITYSSHPLFQFIKVQDKKGLCHHLVNESVFKWV